MLCIMRDYPDLMSLVEFDIDFVTYAPITYIRILIVRPILIEKIIQAQLSDPFAKKHGEDLVVDTLDDCPIASTIVDDNGLGFISRLYVPDTNISRKTVMDEAPHFLFTLEGTRYITT